MLWGAFRPFTRREVFSHTCRCDISIATKLLGLLECSRRWRRILSAEFFDQLWTWFFDCWDFSRGEGFNLCNNNISACWFNEDEQLICRKIFKMFSSSYSKLKISWTANILENASPTVKSFKQFHAISHEKLRDEHLARRLNVDSDGSTHQIYSISKSR